MGIDAVKGDKAKFIHCIMSEEPDIKLKKRYKPSIRLKENSRSVYFKSRKILIHMLHMVVAKVNQMVEEGILANVIQGDSI